MENILSKEEVNALLVGIAAGDVPLGQAGPKRSRIDGAEAYSLVKSPRVSLGRIQSLDSFARRMMSTFSSAVRRAVAVESEVVELTYEEFLKSAPMPVSAHPFNIEPLGLKGVVALDLDIISTFIELFMGGSGRRVKKIEGRGFTSLESRLIQRVVQQVLEDLETALGRATPIAIKPFDSDGPARLRSVMPGHEPVLGVSLHVDMEVSGGAVHLCLPASILDALGEELPRRDAARRSTAPLKVNEIIDRLGESAVTLSVELDGSITLKEMMNLKAGDFLSLETSAATPVEVKVEGVPKLWAFPGRINGNWAVMVERMIRKRNQG